MHCVPAWALAPVYDGGESVIRGELVPVDVQQQIPLFRQFVPREDDILKTLAATQPALTPSKKISSLEEGRVFLRNAAAIRILGSRLEGGEGVAIDLLKTGLTPDQFVQMLDRTMETAGYSFRFSPAVLQRLKFVTNPEALTSPEALLADARNLLGLKEGEELSRIVLLEDRFAPDQMASLEGLLDKTDGVLLVLVPALNEQQIIANYTGLLAQEAEAGNVKTISKEIVQIQTVPADIRAVVAFTVRGG